MEAIISEAIDAAGGPLEGAVLDLVNLAAAVEDGQQIFIPNELEPSLEPFLSLPNLAPTTTSKININTASAVRLETLPGIGPSLAKKIVEYREAHGPYVKLDDLLNVSGIGPAKLEGIKDLITVR
jgi:competence protein ComEA